MLDSGIHIVVEQTRKKCYNLPCIDILIIGIQIITQNKVYQ